MVLLIHLAKSENSAGDGGGVNASNILHHNCSLPSPRPPRPMLRLLRAINLWNYMNNSPVDCRLCDSLVGWPMGRIFSPNSWNIVKGSATNHENELVSTISWSITPVGVINQTASRRNGTKLFLYAKRCHRHIISLLLFIMMTITFPCALALHIFVAGARRLSLWFQQWLGAIIMLRWLPVVFLTVCSAATEQDTTAKCRWIQLNGSMPRHLTARLSLNRQNHSHRWLLDCL